MKLSFVSLFALISLAPYGHAKDTVVIKTNYNQKLFAHCQIQLGKDFVQTIQLSEKQNTCLENFSSGRRLRSKEEKRPALFFADEILRIEKREAKSIVADQRSYFLAKKEFGIPEFLKFFPTFDGREVKVGVIDDGISPNQSGFQKTTTGKRKFLARFSNSSLYRVALEKKNLAQALEFKGEKVTEGFLGTASEKKYDYDINNDEEYTDFKVAVFKLKNNPHQICVDSNANGSFEYERECFGSFSKTGEYGFWGESKLVSFTAEYNEEENYVSFSEGERDRDSHGEGVASVIAGHRIGGLFDGVAPGSQILDYDLSEYGIDLFETGYTIGKFLKAIDTLAANGAEVINISYSLYFDSIKSQEKMAQAIYELIKEYKTLIVFSAGNNGPGLGSLNRSSIYPLDVLVVGAYVTPELDAHVHGVTGLPEEGRVVYYSSRGPGANFGGGPSVISPLSSLTHSNPEDGFRGFSGTSSAAPALAGFGSVLISAIKQSGLELNISTLVNAIKLSGKRLPNIPYVEQGHGLPNIFRAYDIYKDLIDGKLIERALPNIFDGVSRENTKSRGLVFTKSELERFKDNGIQKFLSLSSYMSEVIPLEQRMDKLFVGKLKYSHEFINGPEKTWLSEGVVSIGLMIDPKKVNWSGRTEVFAEVEIIDEVSGLTVSVIPVTLIDDSPLADFKKYRFDIGAQDAKRIHFSTNGDTKGIIIETDLRDQSDNRIELSLFDANGVRKKTSWLDKYSLNYSSFEILESGQYQIGIARSKGTKVLTNLNLNVIPVKLKLLQKIVTVENDKISLNVKNEGAELNGKFTLQAKKEVITEGILSLDTEKKLSFTYSDYGVGEYEVEVLPLIPGDLTYPRSTCEQQLIVNDKVEEKTFKKKIEISQEFDHVKVNCLPFDFFYTRDGFEDYHYRVYKLGSNSYSASPTQRIGINERLKVEIPVFSDTLAKEYDIFYLHEGQYSEIKLGSIKIIQ